MSAKSVNVGSLVVAYNDGFNLREIASAAGVSHNHVRNLLLSAGVTMRARGQRKPYDARDLIALRGRGLSYGQIGNKVGLSYNAVRCAIASATRRASAQVAN